MRSATFRLPGHPDHACDILAEAIVDEYVRRDPTSRIRLSVSGGRGVLFVCGDILSQADFDVASLVRRTIGSLGILEEFEPFVSLEPVASERIGHMRMPQEFPVTVTGYATTETSEGVPLPVSLARKIAKRLEDKRQTDADWYWLGPDADVTVLAERVQPSRIIITVEHGKENVQAVRERVASCIEDLADGVTVDVNPLGASERRGLAHASGASGRIVSMYGQPLPALPSMAGLDPASAEKAGSWLARAAALHVMRAAGAKAVLVQATYIPGEILPRTVVVRNESGRDLSSLVNLHELALDRVMNEWWRPNLCSEALRWGFAGLDEMPWEKVLAYAS